MDGYSIKFDHLNILGGAVEQWILPIQMLDSDSKQFKEEDINFVTASTVSVNG